jgi:uncharacterized protein YndB with AHSA1/START domain
MNPIKVNDDTIVQETKIRARAQRIFEALTNPEELLKWWGAKGKFQASHVECDLRPGGKWRMRVTGSGGTESTVAGEYRKIEPPRLLVFTWIREQEDGIETLVRWDLEENDGVTTVRVTHSGLASESLRARNGGWPLILSLLQAHAEEAK